MAVVETSTCLESRQDFYLIDVRSNDQEIISEERIAEESSDFSAMAKAANTFAQEARTGT
jgi:hypothetical protein